jgi:hypothetical protein
MVTLKELEEQKITLSLFNESEDPSFNNEIVEISIPPINFDRDKYKLLFIFIYYCTNVLILININESDINKEFIDFK